MTEKKFFSSTFVAVYLSDFISACARELSNGLFLRFRVAVHAYRCGWRAVGSSSRGPTIYYWTKAINAKVQVKVKTRNQKEKNPLQVCVNLPKQARYSEPELCLSAPTAKCLPRAPLKWCWSARGSKSTWATAPWRGNSCAGLAET